MQSNGNDDIRSLAHLARNPLLGVEYLDTGVRRTWSLRFARRKASRFELGSTKRTGSLDGLWMADRELAGAFQNIGQDSQFI
jgi:hypothetical protein